MDFCPRKCGQQRSGVQLWLAWLLVALVSSVCGAQDAPRAKAKRPPPDKGPLAEGETAAKKPATKTPASRPGRVASLPEVPVVPGGWLTAQQVEQLAPLSFTSTNTSLRSTLHNLSRALRLAIVLDRRIDPEQRLDLDLADVPLSAALDQIAGKVHSGAAVLGPVAYLAPPQAARQLRTLSALRTEEVERLPPRIKAPLLVSRATKWQSLAMPSEILKRLRDEAGIEIIGLDKVPHDLLAATDLPAMPWIDRLALVAVQFGLTFKLERGGRAVELVPIGESVLLERSYPAGRDARETVENWKKLAPDAEIDLAGGRIVVRGRVEDHERVAPPRPAPRGNARPGTQVYTLKMEQVPLDGFLAQLGQKLSLSFELDAAALAAAGIKPDSAVNVDVQNASLEELLRAALGPLGLESARNGKTVKVTVKRPD